MISRENQKEFESLGPADVQRRVSASIWSEAKSREARIWLSNQESRIARKQNTAQMIAAAAAVVVAIATVIALILSYIK
jgi:hypothetical protein